MVMAEAYSLNIKAQTKTLVTKAKTKAKTSAKTLPLLSGNKNIHRLVFCV